MSSEQYKIVYSGGVLDGHNKGSVKKKLSALFKKDEKFMDQLFSGRPVVVKKGVDKQTAIKYKAAFKKAGADCKVFLVSKIAKKDVVAEKPIIDAPKSPQMMCPKCGSEQDVTKECTTCGLASENFERFKKGELKSVDEDSVAETEESDDSQDYEEDATNESSTTMRPAGFWVRGVAFQLDCFIALFVTMCFEMGIAGVIAFGKNAGGGQSYFSSFVSSFMEMQTSLVSAIVTIIVPFLYNIYFWTKKGATPGKMLLGLKVTGDGEENLSTGKAVVRYISYFLSFIPLALGFLWIAFSKKKKAWHDQLAGSQVVRVSDLSAGRVIMALFIPWVPSVLVLLIISSSIIATGSKSSLSFLLSSFKMGGSGRVQEKNNFGSINLESSNIEKKIDNRIVLIQAGLDLSGYEKLFFELYPKNKVDPYEKGISVTKGPVFIQRSSFWSGTNTPHIWLKIKIAPLPNIALDRRFVRISIDKVIGKSGGNLYDQSSQLEKPFFQQLNLSLPINGEGYYSSTRDVYLVNGTKEKDIDTILGEVIFTLPVNLKMIDIDLARQGVAKKETVHGDNLQLEEAKEGFVKLKYFGDVSRLITIYAFDNEGNRLEIADSSVQSVKGVSDLRYRFYGVVKKIQCIVAEEFSEKAVSFKL